MSTWVLGEFQDPEGMKQAASRLVDAGHGGLDTHMPYPVHGVEEAMRVRRSVVPKVAFAGGALGLFTAVAIQVGMNAYWFPINVANRGVFSWPQYTPIMFELMVLFAALFIFFGLMVLYRFPQPYHPVFESEAFRSATTHAFWVSVPVAGQEDAVRVAEQLREWGASHVDVVREEAR